ncbi:hypothetical protein FGO68_gene16652 [Halteria grandinella]|uniref:Uncharacterized protein n=1 Tax=Halteria grandinella TaxID=5974 RepID=A0A8J8T860_HALGN|nr:hypothetical protein FGO68_gene16652 [Halteria grandinella]
MFSQLNLMARLIQEEPRNLIQLSLINNSRLPFGLWANCANQHEVSQIIIKFQYYGLLEVRNFSISDQFILPRSSWVSAQGYNSQSSKPETFP